MAHLELVEERLTHSVIGAFFEVYNNLGYGFLEHVYVMALERELIARSIVSRAKSPCKSFIRMTT
jgi:GxxExxY protein